MEKSKRYIYMDFLKLIASFAVVTLHSSGGNFSFVHIYPSLIVTILVQVIFCVGVPIFFMESGATILSYRQRYGTKVYVNKRIKKVVIPFVFWSCFGYVYLLLFHQISNYSVSDFVYRFLFGEIVAPYWFFYNLIGFYICAPFLSKIMLKKNKNLILYIILVSIFIKALLPSIFTFMSMPIPGFISSVPMMGEYLEYFILGWYINQFDISSKNEKLLLICGVTSLCITIVATPIVSIHVGYIYKPIYDIANIFTVMIMINIFVLSKKIDNIQFFNKYKKIIQKISGLTFGVYLIHPFLLEIVNRFNSLEQTGVPHIIVTPFVVFVLSMSITWLLKKIPLINYILP